MVYWYSIQNKKSSILPLIDFFNGQTGTYAFVPKIEKWIGANRVRNYVVIDMYPSYIFVKSHLNETEFLQEYDSFFNDISRAAELVKQGDAYAMPYAVQEVYERLFGGDDIIRHSIGDDNGAHFVIRQGPLMGLENHIAKVNKHHRFCLLDFPSIGLKMKVPLEVICRF